MKFALAGVASFVQQRRRALVLGSLTVLLHWFLLLWIVHHMGPRRDVRRDPERIAMVSISLPRQSTPLQVAPAPLPPPPRATPKPRKTPKPMVIAPPELQVEAREPTFAEALTDAMAQPGNGAVVGIPGEKGPPLEAPPPVVSEIVQVAVAAPPEPKLPVYKMAPPPSADLVLNVDRVDADGTRWSGEAAIGWRRAAERYRVKVEIGISVLVTRVNLVVLTSEGALGEAGLVPVKMTEKRRGRSETATHFNAADQKITFSASQASFALLAGAQDKASIPLQLAAIGRGDPSQLTGEIAVQVAEDKDASVYRFVVVGQEEIETRMGRMQTVHLSRPPVAGAYSSRLDIWLAPGHDWYPVRISNLEASGAVTTQTVSKITLTDTGS
ncbi:DUF3108 domain-containing protein [Massilia sp. S19_KUP03_FR1]|uniref:DUF3108 domain-containing protein n=1 Tax=Massilia sp. S19_KUP03_FR1 TaxID=3025503 RepID=UPI002FCD97EC